MKIEVDISEIKAFIQKNDEDFKSYLFQITKITVVKIIRHYHATKIDSFFNKKHLKSFKTTDDELYASHTSGKYSSIINVSGDSHYFWLNEAFNFYIKIKEIKSGDRIILDDVEKIGFDYLMVYINNFSIKNKEMEVKKNSIGFHNENNKEG